jgi:tetratricopeptide (TPR) repeat protein
MASFSIEDFLREFDQEIEPKLLFNDPFKLFQNKTPQEVLDEYLNDGSIVGWDRLALLTRRMIVADRFLELGRGLRDLDLGKTLLGRLTPGNCKERFEELRFYNTCGLIHYRSGDYKKAHDHFKQAEIRSISDLHAFWPDTHSNVLRTEHEFFAMTWAAHLVDSSYRAYVTSKYTEDGLIGKYDKAIRRAESMESGIPSNLKVFYCHGMASLYHNRGEILYFVAQRGKDDFDEKLSKEDMALASHESSLSWGEKSGDVYRILQSKRFLSTMRNIDDVRRNEYLNDVVNGKWSRGKQIIIQGRLSKAKDEGEVANLIKELKTEDGFPDKIVVLFNLRKLKDRWEEFECIKRKYPDQYDLLKRIVRVADSFRENLSFLLYRRQIMGQVRLELRELAEYHWKRKEWEAALDWLEQSSCREILEISQISTNLAVTDSDTYAKINEKKLALMKSELDRLMKDHQIVTDQGDRIFLPPRESPHETLNLASIVEEAESNLHLTLAYEDIFSVRSVSGEVINEAFWAEPAVSRVRRRLRELRRDDMQVIIIRMVKLRDSIGLCLLDSQGRFDSYEKPFEDKSLDKLIEDLKVCASSKPTITGMIKFRQKMEDFSEAINLSEILSNRDNKIYSKKVIFFIPDAVLLSLPLHLLGPEGRDLRTKDSGAWDIYYCPSLNVLSEIGRTNSEMGQFRNGPTHLWIHSPTPDLEMRTEHPLRRPAWVDNDLCLSGGQATLEAFWTTLVSKRPTHLGFSAHGKFNDNSRDAYLSKILFSNNFLTAYDVLLGPDLNWIQTIFMGACEIGTSRFTEQSEAVGLMTAFITKGVRSVVGALWPITIGLHNDLLNTLADMRIGDNIGPWNISELARKSEMDEYMLTPFVQCGTLGLLDKEI